MARSGWLRRHRTWEDWAGIGLGVLVALSPWIARQTAMHTLVYASFALGVVIVLAGQLELMRLSRPLEFIQLACGLLLLALPFILDYATSGGLRYWHFGLGALITLLAVLELRQDRRASE